MVLSLNCGAGGTEVYTLEPGGGKRKVLNKRDIGVITLIQNSASNLLKGGGANLGIKSKCLRVQTFGLPDIEIPEKSVMLRHTGSPSLLLIQFIGIIHQLCEIIKKIDKKWKIGIKIAINIKFNILNSCGMEAPDEVQKHLIQVSQAWDTCIRCFCTSNAVFDPGKMPGLPAG